MNNRKKGLWILIPLAILAVVGIVVLIIMINQKNVDPEEDKQPVVTPEELCVNALIGRHPFSTLW